jgi:hypothetical protein
MHCWNNPVGPVLLAPMDVSVAWCGYERPQAVIATRYQSRSRCCILCQRTSYSRLAACTATATLLSCWELLRNETCVRYEGGQLFYFEGSSSVGSSNSWTRRREAVSCCVTAAAGSTRNQVQP